MSSADEPQRKSRKGLWAAIILLSLFLGFSLLGNLAMGVALSVIGRSFDAAFYPEDECPRLEERWSYGSGEVKAVRIPITGVIFRQQPQDFLFGMEQDIVEHIQRQVRAASNDEDVKALILEIDSPGGDIASVDEIYASLLDFKASREDRLIVAFVRGLAASGGYYVATAADWIIAEPTSLVGSISAIMQMLNWKELSDKIGIRDVTIKTGDNKDLLNPFDEIKPERVALMQELLDSVHEHFFNVVMTGRDMDSDVLAELADGRVFTVSQAMNNGLIDQVGYWQDVMECASDMLGEPAVKIVKYEERPSFLKMFSQIRLPFGHMPWVRQQPRLMYLWNPQGVQAF